ncbi:MAG: hypothetical protein ACEPOW_04770 [Bacteroidales bacterium]
MKKVIVLFALALLVGSFISSCKTRHKCPAYGEVHKYQKNPKQ